MKSLLQKIEAYKALAAGMKEAFPDVSELHFRIQDVPMDEFHEAVKKYGGYPDKMEGCFRLHLSDFQSYTIFVYSVPVFADLKEQAA